MEKYVQTLKKIEPDQNTKQEFFKKALQYKTQLLNVSGLNNRDKPKSKWRIKHSIIAVSMAMIILFFAISIPIFASLNLWSKERVIILDISANMTTIQKNGKTRFENSIEDIKNQASKILSSNKKLRLIVAAGQTKEVVCTSLSEFNLAIDAVECTFGNLDINSASKIVDDILIKNKRASIDFYSALKLSSSKITHKDAFEDEWNVAINSLNKTLEEGFYKFCAEITSYNKDAELTVYLSAKGVNSQFESINAEKKIAFSKNQPTIIEFDDLQIYEYDSVRVFVENKDSFYYDNQMYVYEGRKETLNIQYVSEYPSPFVNTVLHVMNDTSAKWKLKIDTILPNNMVFEGYDFYIIENYDDTYPINQLPKDGFVFFINPQKTPTGFGFEVGETIFLAQDGTNILSKGKDSPVMNYVNPKEIEIERYKKIDNFDGFDVLMHYQNDLIFMIKNTVLQKTAVLNLDLRQSNLALLPSFAVLFNNMFINMFDYFLPSTVEKHIFEVDEKIEVKARGSSILIENNYGYNKTFDDFPAIETAFMPGEYSLRQTLLSNKIITSNIFVRINHQQSNFYRD